MNGTSICIVTKDRVGTLRETLTALRVHTTGVFEVIIVDNGSTDQHQLALLDQAEADGYTVIRNPENLGLSKATNQGFAAAQYDCLIHMDDDVLVALPGWNEAFRRCLENSPEVGLAAPDRGPAGNIRYPTYNEGRWFLGMCWAMRRSIFQEIGGYDEQLIHQQECDMALRIRMHGYKAVACHEVPDAQIIHNDHAQQTEMSKARENMGTVQFHDKWCLYFRGQSCHWGTVPRFLMQHFPIDQDFFYRLTKHLDLNVDPEVIYFDGWPYYVYKDMRLDDAFTSLAENEEPNYAISRAEIESKWLELTGEPYAGYVWHHLPYDNR